MEQEQIEIRDHRNKQWFWVDDEYLNGYARLLRPNSTLVYLALCRHANKEQQSWPSYDLLMEKLGLARATISNAIKELEEWRIIRVERSRNEQTKRQNPNVYILLDKRSWQPKPSSNSELRAEFNSEQEPSSIDDKKPSSNSELEVNTVTEVNTKNQTERTPKQLAVDLFTNSDTQAKAVSYLTSKGFDETRAQLEVRKFIAYWTEQNHIGNKQRWQMEKAFDVRRRFATWIERIKQPTNGGGRTRTIWK
jgi:hypothetical protein